MLRIAPRGLDGEGWPDGGLPALILVSVGVDDERKYEASRLEVAAPVERSSLVDGPALYEDVITILRVEQRVAREPVDLAELVAADDGELTVTLAVALVLRRVQAAELKQAGLISAREGRGGMSAQAREEGADGVRVWIDARRIAR